MKKQHITIIVAIIGVLLIGWAVYTTVQTRSGSRIENQTATTSNQTSTGSTTNTNSGIKATSTLGAQGLTISNVKVEGAPGMKPYLNTQYGFIFAYPEKDAIIIPVAIPASEATPLLYRSDAEFAFCVKERKTSKGCAPIVTLGLADGSGHGVSVYALRHSDVKAMYPKVENNSIVDKDTDTQYFIYYSDTTSINATDAQNKKRQQIMSAIGNSFTLLE